MQSKMIWVKVFLTLLACGQQAYAQDCKPTGKNYLLNPDFTKDPDGKRVTHWYGSQHAGEISFQSDITDGVLTIIRVGTQPWYVFRQRLKDPQFAGQTMVFGAELKFDLSESPESSKVAKGSGLKVVARNKNRKILLRTADDHEPSPGKADWEPVQIHIKLPEKTAQVELDFLYKTDVPMQVRKPGFWRADEFTGNCPAHSAN